VDNQKSEEKPVRGAVRQLLVKIDAYQQYLREHKQQKYLTKKVLMKGIKNVKQTVLYTYAN